MSDSNTTHFTNPSYFILLGIPGLEAAYVWIAIPFCVMYIIAILGNFTILLIVRVELSLHEPMYYFVCNLAVCNLIVSTCTMPKMLSIFWFNSREIDFNACFTQQYFTNCFLVTEYGIITALAFDRYVAICDPLRHSTILRNSVVAKISLAVLLRGSLIILPLPLVASRLPYCRSNIITHMHCENTAVLRLACADIRIASYYDSFVLFSVTLPDACFIIFSYIQIIRAVFRLPMKDARQKTFGTCGSHICVLLTSVIPGFFSFSIYQFGHNVPRYIHILFGIVHLLVPPVFNPIIYGVRTKQIWNRLLQLFTHKGS